MTFLVSLDAFEGPLDLMLHLIKEKELDLFHLDVNVLTDQYAAYLHQSEELHLEIAGEYLAELAGLLELKSRSLLPKPVTLSLEEEEDPKEKLIRRLIEYQRFKDVSRILSEYQQERSRQYAKPLSLLDENKNTDIDISSLNGNPYDLMKAMNRCLRHMVLAAPREATFRPQEYSLAKITEEIEQRYQTRTDKIDIREMIADCSSLPQVVVTFLAVLDMIHQGKLLFTVTKKNDIWLKWSEVHG